VRGTPSQTPSGGMGRFRHVKRRGGIYPCTGSPFQATVRQSVRMTICSASPTIRSITLGTKDPVGRLLKKGTGPEYKALTPVKARFVEVPVPFFNE
jgi:hypothetical protein